MVRTFDLYILLAYVSYLLLPVSILKIREQGRPRRVRHV